MAEKAFKKLDDQLNCSICLDTYTDPKLLQCFHIYCTKCLARLVVRDQQRQLGLTCPNCRQVTPIPPNGVTGLQSAFRINELLEIRDDLKKAKDPTPSPEGVEDGATSQTPSKKITHYCSEHVDKEHELYCETCNELICYKCVIRGGKHQSHDYDPLDDAFDKYKGEIIPLLEPMEKQLKTIHTALAQLDTCSGNISDQRETTEVRIHNTIRRLHEILDVRKTELIGQLHHLTQGKLKGLTTQRDHLEIIQVQLSSCLDFVNHSLKTGSQGEVLMMKTTIVNQVKELTTPFQPDLLKPNTEVDMTFSPSHDLTAVCKKYGKVFSRGSPDPSSCHATGKDLEVAMVGEKSTTVLHAIDFNGQPCVEPIKSLQCELVSELIHASVGGSLERRGQSQYEIIYQPTIKGRHQLHINVEGQHIRGSPFTLTVKSPVEKLGTPILTIDRVKEPYGVTFNQRGEVVVTELGGDCVSVFSPSGEKLRSFGTHGSGQGQFKYPSGVAVDGERNILVVDSDNHHIQQFTADGQFITSVGSKGKGPLQFSSPEGITYNTSNNKVYVVDSGNHRVQVLNSDLTFCSSFGKRGSGNGEFDTPCDISCDSTGMVYVADCNRIRVFTAEGKFLRMFGRRGHGRGELNYPISITVDTSDRVYIGDHSNRVSVFTSDGQFITSFGRCGNGLGEFSFPYGLAVDASGVLYVCDIANNRIQVF